MLATPAVPIRPGLAVTAAVVVMMSVSVALSISLIVCVCARLLHTHTRCVALATLLVLSFFLSVSCLVGLWTLLVEALLPSSRIVGRVPANYR